MGWTLVACIGLWCWLWVVTQLLVFRLLCILDKLGQTQPASL